MSSDGLRAGKKKMSGFELTLSSSLRIPCGLLTVNDLSYGTTVCRMEGNIVYVFFYSHGRTSKGTANGPHCAAIYFNKISEIIDFLYYQFRCTSGFSLYPIQFSKEPELIILLRIHFFDVVCSSHIKSFSKFTKHFHCVVLSMCAISYAHQNGMESWVKSTLDDIFSKGNTYYTY